MHLCYCWMYKEICNLGGKLKLCGYYYIFFFYSLLYGEVINIVLSYWNKS